MDEEGFVVSDVVLLHLLVSQCMAWWLAFSPVKKSSNTGEQYFNSSFTDRKKILRLVSFEPKLCNQFEEAQKSRSPIAVKNCMVKEEELMS